MLLCTFVAVCQDSHSKLTGMAYLLSCHGDGPHLWSTLGTILGKAHPRNTGVTCWLHTVLFCFVFFLFGTSSIHLEFIIAVYLLGNRF